MYKERYLMIISNHLLEFGSDNSKWVEKIFKYHYLNVDDTLNGKFLLTGYYCDADVYNAVMLELYIYALHINIPAYCLV